MISIVKNKKHLPLFVLAFFILVIFIILSSKPTVKRSHDNDPAPIEVDVLTISRAPFPIYVKTYGLAESLVHTQLVARVGGTVEKISEKFREGAYFKKGDILARLEKSDYQIELDIAEASVAEAESRYANEKALAEEARDDWKRSGRTGEPPALALRLPQLEAASAALKSAQASVARAKLNLARADIRAPYDGSVLSKNIDLGQFVNANVVIGEIFSTDMAEIRLPIQNDELRLLGLDMSASTIENGPKVIFHSSIAEGRTWEGTIVRIASAIDTQSRQIHLIARIPSPFISTSDKASMKVGEYLTAEIQGTTIPSAIVVPTKAIYQGQYVFVFEDGKVNRKPIEIQWSDTEQALLSSGLNEGEQLVITTLGQLPSGTAAKIADTTATAEANKNQNQSVNTQQ